MSGEKTSGVRAKLEAHKKAHAGERTVTLNECGVNCTVPKFINHGIWMKAQRIAKGDLARAQAAFVCETVTFEGEKLTLTDLSELVPASDAMQLINEIFGSDEDEAGNGTAMTVN